jgi:hypothetical protein
MVASRCSWGHPFDCVEQVKPLRFVRLRGKAPRFNVTLVAQEHLELSAASRAFYEMVVMVR